MTERAAYMLTSAVLAFLIIVMLASCAPPPATINPQARYLTSSTTPICLAFCTVVVTSTEAAQFPELRRAGEVTGNSKSTTTSSSVSNPP